MLTKYLYYFNINCCKRRRDRGQHFELDDIALDYLKGKGLKNFGSNCYLNSIIQCFFHCRKLTDYLIQNKENCKGEITKEYTNLIIKLKDNKDKTNPNTRLLLEALKKKDEFYIMGGGKDPKKVIKDLLYYFQQELISEEKVSGNINNISVENKSIISELFYWRLKTEHTCLKCKNIEPDFTVKDLIIINMDLFSMRKSISVEEILEDYFKEKKKKNDFFCEKCNEIVNIKEKNSIEEPPQYLIVVLNREKLQLSIEYKPYLELSKFNNSGSIKYNLVGLSLSNDSNKKGNHSIALCKVDKKKYLFDDETVEIYEKDYIEGFNPYILFYEKEEEIF